MQTWRVVGVASAIVIAASVLGYTQGLAAVARKEKARQAKVKESGQTAKVYTDEVKRAAPTVEGAARVSLPGTKEGAEATQGSEVVGSPDATETTRVPAAPPNVTAPPVRDRSDRRSLRDVSVTMYVTSWCPYCRAARAFLMSQPNVRLIEHDIEKDKARSTEMLAKTGGARGVPVIDVEGLVMQGFSPGSVTAALADARNRSRR